MPSLFEVATNNDAMKNKDLGDNIIGTTQRHRPPDANTNDRSSKSRLEPVLRETGHLERAPGRRKPGRPRIIASWFPQVAETMADGTSLKAALERNGITLDSAQLRALYRNTEFRRIVRETRSSNTKES